MISLTKTITTKTGKQNTISLTKGDIAQVPAQAMITAINSAGIWFGGIDGVIQRNCGYQFHQQAVKRSPLKHLDTIVAKKTQTQTQTHRALFQDVIFVVDDLQTPLHKVVYAALEAAGEAGYTVVSLPAIRTGVMLGVVEKDAKTAVGELLMGITDYYEDYPDSPISNLIFVIYDSGEVYNLLQTTPLIGSGE